MVIISAGRKDSDTVSLTLDNGEKLFLSYEVFLKNGLRKGKEISEDLFSFLIRENKKYFIKAYSLKLLSRRLHSSFEINVKLRQRKYDNELIGEVINELIANRIIDDYKFAVQYSDENIRNKLWGKTKVRSELIKRKIDSEIIDKVLELKFPAGNDLELAVELGRKKIKMLSYKNLDNQQLKQKVILYLYSKGYDYDTGKQALDKLFSNE